VRAPSVPISRQRPCPQAAATDSLSWSRLHGNRADAGPAPAVAEPGRADLVAVGGGPDTPSVPSILRSCEGFRMTAHSRTIPGARGPSSESLQGRNLREMGWRMPGAMGIWLWRTEGIMLAAAPRRRTAGDGEAGGANYEHVESVDNIAGHRRHSRRETRRIGFGRRNGYLVRFEVPAERIPPRPRCSAWCRIR
jgi:hypothetical protein